ncbi:Dps family protein [Parasphaerochaeta coccoides]|uniref:Ferritin Dps family protein n=1 Tax=Parasphaerochaeta coccoides (strain ATCC BAA-1237 / DSM 17374 / SPN1) TaxID=760011 RepID=F4GKQ7_PARC1|nr:DNA starvation/stationary phase protection protein [Parasphaerochaeta coccoides]AEC01466.1 Ferritin Dps family protein [Parasphaerochaeta coccoides DSM 17374]
MNKKISDALKKHTADSFVLWSKFHNLHWNVYGPQFKATHVLLEEYYDELSEDFDAFAERLLQLGDKPPVTIDQFKKLTSFSEETKDSFSAEESLSIILKDFEALNKEYSAAKAAAAEADDYATEDLYSGIISRIQKQIWMLKATLQK